MSSVVWHFMRALDGFYGASEDRGEVELEYVDLAESGQVASLRFRVKR